MTIVRQLMKISCAAVLAACVLGGTAEAQTIGTFRWQLAPYCNIVTLTVVQTGTVYTLNGYDDQCGGTAPRASTSGMAFFNPDGSVGFGLTYINAPAGTTLHLSASLSLATLGGAWRDSSGQTGTLTFTPGNGTGGAVRPVSGQGLALPLILGGRAPISAAEIFGLHGDGDPYLGMYASTTSPNGVPFYGYSTGNNAQHAWHDFDGANTTWRLVINSGPVMTLNPNSAANFLVLGNGAKNDSGTWTNASDRKLKTGFASVDTADVLKRVSQLPIQAWTYKADGQARHIGPMAQDFRKAFGLGSDDTTIATVDADGVALAAIQELHKAMQEKDAQIADLTARLAALEQAIKSQR